MATHRQGHPRWQAALGAALLGGVPTLWAQTGEVAAVAVATDVTGLTFGQMLRAGGWIMFLIGLLSVAALALVIYLAVILRSSQIVPDSLHRELVDKTRLGRLEEARRVCEYRPSPLSLVAMAALDYVRSTPQPDPLLLREVMESEGQRQAEAMQGQIQYLLDIAVVAPMAGFLGTVLGMLKAFNAVAMDLAKARPMILAAGVTQALVTTVFGLLVAIPAMLFYAYFRRKASTLTCQLESAATELLTALQTRKTP